MLKSAHTRGTWKRTISLSGTDVSIYADTPVSRNPRHIARVYGEGALSLEHAERDANAARIVDCVNACDEVADPGVIPDAVQLLRDLLSTNLLHGDHGDSEERHRLMTVLARVNGKVLE